MKLPDLDIPPGLEDAYYSVIRFLGGVTGDAGTIQRIPPAKRLRKSVANRSLFVRWQDLYNGLDSGRHAAWTAYWITLPFSDHGGENGWPGSGYSAFIYVNTPRYHAGLDLLLDPPAVGNILINGDFNGTSDPWVLGDNAVYDTDRLLVAPNDYGGGFFYNPGLTMTDGATYRVTFDCKLNALNFDGDGDSFTNIVVGVGADSFPLPGIDLHPYADGTWQTVTLDILAETAGADPGDCIFKFYPGLVDVLDGTALELDNFTCTLLP